jgi:hypothetical protein
MRYVKALGCGKTRPGLDEPATSAKLPSRGETIRREAQRYGVASITVNWWLSPGAWWMRQSGTPSWMRLTRAGPRIQLWTHPLLSAEPVSFIEELAPTATREAVAWAGAMGAGLVAMVARTDHRKKKYAEVK